MDDQDILCEERDGSARVAINRPDVMNALHGQTAEVPRPAPARPQ